MIVLSVPASSELGSAKEQPPSTTPGVLGPETGDRAGSKHRPVDALHAVAEPTTTPVPNAAVSQQQRGAERYPVYRIVVGTERTHRVEAGDTLAALARRYHVSVAVTQRRNGIHDPRRLRIGQRLVLSNQHVVAAPFAAGLVVDLDLLALFVVRESRVAARYPIAAGRPAWETPPGLYHITGRRKDPVWYVPPSIQREMQALGQPVRRVVPPGPDNPLGRFWLQLSAPGIGIHGTNAPWSVGRYATHGCIRLHNEHVETLFREVPDGTPVAIVREPIRIGRTASGRVFLEAHERAGPQALEQIRKALDREGAASEVDWQRAAQVLSAAWGVAVDVTRKPVPAAETSPSLAPPESGASREPAH